MNHIHGPLQSSPVWFFVLLSLLFCFFQSPSTSYHATFAPFTQDYSMFLKYTLLFHLCTSAQAVVPLFSNVLLLLLFPTSIPYPKSPPHWKKIHCSLFRVHLKYHFLHGASQVPQAKSLSSLEAKQYCKEGSQDGGLCLSLTHPIYLAEVIPDPKLRL